MADYAWEILLAQWSREILASRSFAEFLEHLGDEYPGVYPPEVLSSGWLGYRGASEEQIAGAEARLGVALPPDYRSFLRLTNGWRYLDQFIPRLWAVEELQWLRDTDPELVEVWAEEDATAELREGQYIASTLRISDQEIAGSAILLLNPQVTTPAGEWEAWFMAHWVPGANICPSFWEMMHSLHDNFLYVEANT